MAHFISKMNSYGKLKISKILHATWPFLSKKNWEGAPSPGRVTVLCAEDTVTVLCAEDTVTVLCADDTIYQFKSSK